MQSIHEIFYEFDLLLSIHFLSQDERNYIVNLTHQRRSTSGSETFDDKLTTHRNENVSKKDNSGSELNLPPTALDSFVDVAKMEIAEDLKGDKDIDIKDIYQNDIRQLKSKIQFL